MSIQDHEEANKTEEKQEGELMERSALWVKPPSGWVNVAPQILIVLFLIYLFDNIIQLISLRNLWYYGGW
jgi:hypothetical protein